MTICPPEEEKIEKLKQLVEVLKTEGIYNEKRHGDQELLVRFLIARQFNVRKAKDMIKENEIWRNSFRMNEIFDWEGFPERDKVHEILPIFNHKTDKMGRAILYMIFEKCDGHALFKETTEDRLLRMLVRRMEKEDQYILPACEIANPESNHQLLVITDLKGAYFSQFYHFAGFLKKFLQIDLNNYPENLGTQVFINSPMIFSVGFSIIKPILDENTLSKIKVFGSNYKDELLSLIDADNLPEIFGGNCKCAGGCDKSSLGPWNDGSVSGYPKPEWENLEAEDLNVSAS